MTDGGFFSVFSSTLELLTSLFLSTLLLFELNFKLSLSDGVVFDGAVDVSDGVEGSSSFGFFESVRSSR